LGSDGKFVSAEIFEKFIEEMIPSNLMEKAAPKFRKCREDAGSFGRYIQSENTIENWLNLYLILPGGSLMDPAEDEFCKSYDPLIKCMLDVIGTVSLFNYNSYHKL